MSHLRRSFRRGFFNFQQSCGVVVAVVNSRCIKDDTGDPAFDFSPNPDSSWKVKKWGRNNVKLTKPGLESPLYSSFSFHGLLENSSWRPSWLGESSCRIIFHVNKMEWFCPNPNSLAVLRSLNFSLSPYLACPITMPLMPAKVVIKRTFFLTRPYVTRQLCDVQQPLLRFLIAARKQFDTWDGMTLIGGSLVGILCFHEPLGYLREVFWFGSREGCSNRLSCGFHRWVAGSVQRMQELAFLCR